MFRIVQHVKRAVTGTVSKLNRRWLLASAAAVALAAPAVAHAAPRDHDGRFERHEVVRRDYDRHDHERHEWDRHEWDRHDHDHVGIDLHIGGPRYEVREVRVWVPDQFEDREVRYQENGRWCTRVDHVLVVPAHYEGRERQVCVVEGHYDVHTERVPVADGFGLHIGR